MKFIPKIHHFNQCIDCYLFEMLDYLVLLDNSLISILHSFQKKVMMKFRTMLKNEDFENLFRDPLIGDFL